jgi:hypothetical protein
MPVTLLGGTKDLTANLSHTFILLLTLTHLDHSCTHTTTVLTTFDPAFFTEVRSAYLHNTHVHLYHSCTHPYVIFSITNYYFDSFPRYLLYGGTKGLTATTSTSPYTPVGHAGHITTGTKGLTATTSTPPIRLLAMPVYITRRYEGPNC